MLTEENQVGTVMEHVQMCREGGGKEVRQMRVPGRSIFQTEKPQFTVQTCKSKTPLLFPHIVDLSVAPICYLQKKNRSQPSVFIIENLWFTATCAFIFV